MAYRFPGNVRELENVIEQALVFTDGAEITPQALPEAVRGAGAQPSLSTKLDDFDLKSPDRALPDVLDDLERQLILKAYTQGARGEDGDSAPTWDQNQCAVLQVGKVAMIV